MLRGAGALLLGGTASSALLLAPRPRAQRDDAYRRLDVPYVPTPMPVVDAMLDLARVRQGRHAL